MVKILFIKASLWISSNKFEFHEANDSSINNTSLFNNNEGSGITKIFVNITDFRRDSRSSLSTKRERLEWYTPFPVVEIVNKLVEWRHVYLDKWRATRLSQISYVYPPPTQTRDVHKHPEIRSTLSASILLVLCSITTLLNLFKPNLSLLSFVSAMSREIPLFEFIRLYIRKQTGGGYKGNEGRKWKEESIDFRE